MDLGKPIGQQHTVPSAGFDQGEHGAGIGLAGGHGHATSQNTQSGGTHAGSGSASGGLPTGTPIADKFTHQGQGANSVAGAYAGGGTDDALTGQSNAHRTGAGVGPLGENLGPTGASAASGAQHGHQGHSHGQNESSIPAGVSGAYAGGNTSDALTGESHAQRTGAGVGPLGENLPAGHTATSAALAGTAAGAAAGAGAGSSFGTGVGPQGGSGGHYTVDNSSHGQNQSQSHSTQGLGSSGAGAGGLATGTGAAGSQSHDAQRAGAQAHASGENVAAKLGLAGAGAGVGAGAAGAAAGSGAASSTSSGGAGHFGTASTDSSRGAPVSDPKELDHGGRHGLVYQESTGKYVHRHEVDEGK